VEHLVGVVVLLQGVTAHGGYLAHSLAEHINGR
jgi:hypothetical protein